MSNFYVLFDCTESITRVLALITKEEENTQPSDFANMKGMIMNLVKGKALADRPNAVSVLRCRWYTSEPCFSAK
jgi:hypothetical protein